MQDRIVEEVLKNCNWYEKIIVKIFSKTFIKIYHFNRINIVNSILRNLEDNY